MARLSMRALAGQRDSFFPCTRYDRTQTPHAWIPRTEHTFPRPNPPLHAPHRRADRPGCLLLQAVKSATLTEASGRTAVEGL